MIKHRLQVIVLVLAVFGTGLLVWERPTRAGTITVTTLTDEAGSNPGACSLREAIIAANTDTAFGGCPAGTGPDTIVLPSGQTITLSRDADGGGHETDAGASNDDLDITSVIVIQGNGATIQRDATLGCNANTTSNTGEFRLFEVTAAGELTLHHVTLQNGCADGLTFPTALGGGIFNSGRLTIVNSTLSGHIAVADGGGIFNEGTISVTNSTLSGNTAAGDGGGIFNEGTISVTNSTLANNTASFDGGGLFNNLGTANLVHSTVSGNSASFNGGGIANDDTLLIKNTIVGDNTAAADTNCSLIGGTFTPTGVNMATDASCTGFTQVTSAQLQLGPLQDNGGPTPTQALLPGSVAIDAAPNCTDLSGTPVTADQRGVARPQDGNGDGSAVCDIGAFEWATPPTPTPTRTATPTPTPTSTPTPTPTPTRTSTPTRTPTSTPTSTIPATATPTPVPFSHRLFLPTWRR